MEKRLFSNDLANVLTRRAQSVSIQHRHTICGAPHLFLATFGFLSQSQSDPRYKKTYEDLKAILNKFSVDGQKFKEAFLLFFPQGEELEDGVAFNVTTDVDYKRISSNLATKAKALGREMEVEDLIIELFSDKAYSIIDIFESIIGDRSTTEEMYNDVLKAFISSTKESKVDALEKIPELKNISEWVKDHPQTVIGVDEVLKKLQMCLASRSVNSCILTGPAGVGKTTYAYAFAQAINGGMVAEPFLNKIIYKLDPAALVAGTRYRGDFEAKLLNILNVVKKHPEVILFVDEIHMLINSGDSSDGAMNAGNILKPYISDGEVQIIGATTSEEYIKHIHKDKAFCSRFHEIKIKEPSREDTIAILSGLLPVETEFFKKDIQMDLVEKTVDLSAKYSLEMANPRKAINMLELACAYSKVFEEKKTNVDVDDIMHSVKLKYDIYISKNKVEDTRKGLFKVLLGQDAALKQVLRNLRIVEMNVTDIERPALSMLLAGPSGTGKTETCKIIAENFFGNVNNIVKINCGEYTQEIDVTKLTGSSAGYVGYDDEPALIKGVREKPCSVVLFDEIEKAHPEVLKILLNILDTGTMMDNKGNTISFRNNIIVFTTNLGCTKDTGKATGLGFVKTVNGLNGNKIKAAIEDFFLPEFLGRLDDIVMYNSLSKDIALELIERYYTEYMEKSDLPREIKFTQEDIDAIITASEIEIRGARGIRKEVRKRLIECSYKLEEENSTADVE